MILLLLLVNIVSKCIFSFHYLNHLNGIFFSLHTAHLLIFGIFFSDIIKVNSRQHLYRMIKDIKVAYQIVKKFCYYY
jgi:hypothetical protein